MRIQIHEEIGWLGTNGYEYHLDTLIDALKNFRLQCDITAEEKAYVSLDAKNGRLKLRGTRLAFVHEIVEAERGLFDDNL